MSASATLREVAEMAGVSIGTASQALNNRPNVSPDTRDRVVEAAKALGYPLKEPSMSYDANLSVIGMLTKHDHGSDLTVNPFYSYVELGVESECRRRNLSMMMATVEVDQQNRPMVWPAMLSEQRIDALLLIGTFIEDTIGLIQQRLDIPIVLVDGYAPHLPFDSVVTDNFHGGRSAVKYLLDCGHRHIGLIGSGEDSPPGIIKRRHSYFATMRQTGIQDFYVMDTPVSRERAYDATCRLLRQSPQVTAVFSVNDDTAIGAISAANDLGRSVPEELSVIGFDNIDLSKEINPPLTTIHVHKNWLGIMGVRMLVERAQNPNQPKTTTVVSTQLLVRESVRDLIKKQGTESGVSKTRKEVINSNSLEPV